jgi:hypothetical protein
LGLLCLLLNDLLDFLSEVNRLFLEDRPNNSLELLCLPPDERPDFRSEVPHLLFEDPFGNLLILLGLLCEELALPDFVLLRLVSAFSLREETSSELYSSGSFGFSSSSSVVSILSFVSISSLQLITTKQWFSAGQF